MELIELSKVDTTAGTGGFRYIGFINCSLTDLAKVN